MPKVGLPEPTLQHYPSPVPLDPSTTTASDDIPFWCDSVYLGGQRSDRMESDQGLSQSCQRTHDQLELVVRLVVELGTGCTPSSLARTWPRGRRVSLVVVTEYLEP